MKKVILLLLFFQTAFAQLTETEIFLARIEVKNKLLKVDKAANITNHKGYDNQPFFTADGKHILYASEAGDDKHIHITSYDVRGGKSKLLTRTNTSEYSPMLVPGENQMACVVVEEDSTQRIWTYDLITGERKKCLSTTTDSVGYYAFIGRDTLLYYKLTDPHSLRVLDLKSGEDNWICDHPARSFKPLDKRHFFYVIQGAQGNRIMSYDVLIKKATLLAEDKTGNQDYVWNAELGMLKSEGAKIYRYSAETKVWAEVADFTAFGVKKITRFAFSPDNKKIAVVSNIE